jgi:GR25 family glycosyltransferase involved in LPS biosynthesis
MHVKNAIILAVEGRFRGHELFEKLEENGFTVSIIYGMDSSLPEMKALLTTMTDTEVSKAINGRELSFGEIACADVHLSAYEVFLGFKTEWTLIFEDDAFMSESVTNFINQIEILDHPAIIQLHSSPMNNKAIETRKKRLSEDLKSSIHLLIKKIEATNNAHAYLINREAAAKILRLQSSYKIVSPADWPYLWRNEVTFYETQVDFFVQRGASIIETDGQRNQLLAKKVGELPKRDLVKVLKKPQKVIWLMRYRAVLGKKPLRLIFFQEVLLPILRRYHLIRFKIAK